MYVNNGKDQIDKLRDKKIKIEIMYAGKALDHTGNARDHVQNARADIGNGRNLSDRMGWSFVHLPAGVMAILGW